MIGIRDFVHVVGLGHRQLVGYQRRERASGELQVVVVSAGCARRHVMNGQRVDFACDNRHAEALCAAARSSIGKVVSRDIARIETRRISVEKQTDPVRRSQCERRADVLGCREGIAVVLVSSKPQ